MIQVTVLVIIISLQKNHCEPGVHQHPGHNRYAQANSLSKSDLLELHRSSCMDLTTPMQDSSEVSINSRHSILCYKNS